MSEILPTPTTAAQPPADGQEWSPLAAATGNREMRRALPVAIFTDKWPGNDTPDIKRVAGDLAPLVGFSSPTTSSCAAIWNTESLGINDGKARAHVLFAKLHEDFGSRGNGVAQGFPADLCFKSRADALRNTAGKSWQGLFDDQPGNFPVPN